MNSVNGNTALVQLNTVIGDNTVIVLEKPFWPANVANLTLAGGTITTGTNGGRQFLNLRGNTYTATVPTITNTSEASFSFWFNRTLSASLTGIDRQLFSWPRAAGGLIRVHIVNNRLWMWDDGGGFTIDFADSNIPANTWHHIVIVASATHFSNCKTYVDGVSKPFVVQGSTTNMIFPTALTVSGIHPSISMPFLLSDIRFYNSLLTPDEVNSLFIAPV